MKIHSSLLLSGLPRLLFTSFARAHLRARKPALLLFSVAVLLAGGAAAVRGQSARDGFDLNVANPNGYVRVVVVQPWDGKILLGGDFTMLSPNGGPAVPRNHIARLNPDGTLDPTFDPNSNGSVYSIALEPTNPEDNGNILVGGLFTHIGALGTGAYTMIARLSSGGQTAGIADPSFHPSMNNRVHSIAVEADGHILAGGAFTFNGGDTRNFIARLNANGSYDGTFPEANDRVYSIAVRNGQIFAGGEFSIIGGQTRNYIARLNPDGTAHPTFNPNANAAVSSIAVQADGKILAGGRFTNFGVPPNILTRHRIARLDATTGLADSFNPNASDFVESVAVQADGKILVGGEFNDLGSGAISIGGQVRNLIARLDATTGLADSFDPNASCPFCLPYVRPAVYAIAVQADGKVLAGGVFTSLTPNGGVVPVPRNSIARLETDGRQDQALKADLNPGGVVYATAVQPDGKILIGGSFTKVMNATHSNIARLNTDGTLDTNFTGSVIFGGGVIETPVIYSIAVQADGNILVGGYFNEAGGLACGDICRLTSTGVYSYGQFNLNAGPYHWPYGLSAVYSIALQPTGEILVGGDFNRAGRAVRSNIARLNATTGLADPFNPSANGTVYSIVVQAHGFTTAGVDANILVGGAFTSIGGQPPRNHIARLFPSGTAIGNADFWDPNANDTVYAIAAPGGGGDIIAGGAFNDLGITGAITIGGRSRNHIARLRYNAASKYVANPMWDPNADGDVRSIAWQADGKILAGGAFYGTPSIGGQPRNLIARLNAGTGSADSFNPNPDLTGIIYGVTSIAVQADGKILAGGDFTSFLLNGGPPPSVARIGFARLSNDTAALQNLAVTPTAITWTLGGSSPQFTRVTFEIRNIFSNYDTLGSGTAAGRSWTLTGLSFHPGTGNIFIRARGYYRSGYNNGSESIMESVRNAFIP